MNVYIIQQIPVYYECLPSHIEYQLDVSTGECFHCSLSTEARCSSMVRAFAHGAMGRRIDPSWGGPIELFLIPTRAL